MIAGAKEITAAYRKLLDREPDEEGMRTWLDAQVSPEALADSIMRSEEYGVQPVNVEEVIWSYRVLLGREPSEADIQEYLDAKFPREALTRAIMLSPEFRARQVALKSIALYGLEFLVRECERMYDADYEPHVFHELMKHMRPGVTFLDIGANVGCFSIHAAKLGAHVVAIEPRPSNTSLLLANSRRNSAAIELHPLGASDSAGYAVLRLAKDANAAIRELEPTSIGDEVIATQRIDTIVGDRHIDVIKIDIEGHEYRAMLGAQRLLARDRPVIFTEYSPDFQRVGSGVDGMTYLNLLFQHGYRTFALTDKGPVPIDPPNIDSEWRKAPTHIDLLLQPTI